MAEKRESRQSNNPDAINRFIDEYMLDLNGGEAAVRAGMASSAGSGRGVAWRLMQRREVREEIDRRIAAARASAKLTVDRIEGMLRDIAETEIIDIYNEDGTLRPFGEWPPHARRAVKSIETKEDMISGKVTTEVTLWDKKGAIELLGKYKKMFTDKLEVAGEDGGPLKVTFKFEGVPE